MLILTARKGSRLLIGNNVVLEVVRIGQTTVRFAFHGPCAGRVIREEIAADEEIIRIRELTGETPAGPSPSAPIINS